MGFFSGIASFCSNAVKKVTSFLTGGGGSEAVSVLPPYIGGISISHTYSTTTYDPDRVKAAQLDKERAEIENERIGLMRQAQLDIIEAQEQSRIAQERARAEGFVKIAEAITAMQEKLNEMAAQRIAIIERGDLQAVREAENFYAELEKEIHYEQEKYMTQKLPALFEILERYEAGSSSHTLYFETIQKGL